MERRAVEPVIRNAIMRMLPVDSLPAAMYAGSYWTRTNDVEIDLVGADSSPIAENVVFVGSIKWRRNAPFNSSDLSALIAQRSKMPGATPETRLVAVSRSGFEVDGLDAALEPRDLISPWRTL